MAKTKRRLAGISANFGRDLLDSVKTTVYGQLGEVEETVSSVKKLQMELGERHLMINNCENFRKQLKWQFQPLDMGDSKLLNLRILYIRPILVTIGNFQPLDMGDSKLLNLCILYIRPILVTI